LVWIIEINKRVINTNINSKKINYTIMNFTVTNVVEIIMKINFQIGLNSFLIVLMIKKIANKYSQSLRILFTFFSLIFFFKGNKSGCECWFKPDWTSKCGKWKSWLKPDWTSKSRQDFSKSHLTVFTFCYSFIFQKK